MKPISERALEIAEFFGRDYSRLEAGNLAQALDEYQSEVDEWRAKVEKTLSLAALRPLPLSIAQPGDLTSRYEPEPESE